MFKGIISFSISILVFTSLASFTTRAAELEQPEQSEASATALTTELPSVPAPIQFPADFKISDFEAKPWLKQFQYVVVVNKANEGSERQTVQVYFNQTLIKVEDVVNYLDRVQDLEQSQLNVLLSKESPNRDERKLVETLTKSLAERQSRIAELPTLVRSEGLFKVSTGRDQFEKKGEHHSQNDSWTVTPTGYFVPQAFEQRHKSESYSNSLCDSWLGKLLSSSRGKDSCTWMENVVFFNNAIGLHKAIPGTEDALGTKASGGCVRLPAALAEFLYRNIKMATTEGGVPVVDNSGNVKVDANGQVVLEKIHKSDWGSMTARSALIIVKSEIVP